MKKKKIDKLCQSRTLDGFYCSYLWFVCSMTYQPLWVIKCQNDVVVNVVGNGHSDTSSIPGRDRLHFT